MGKGGGEIARLSDDSAEGAVFVVGGEDTGIVCAFGDVTLGVVSGECGRHGGRPSRMDGKQAADTSGALEGSAEF